MFSDANYHYYGSAMNRIKRSELRCGKHTIITAKDSKGNITFRSKSKRLTNAQIERELQRWAIDVTKETVEIQTI